MASLFLPRTKTMKSILKFLVVLLSIVPEIAFPNPLKIETISQVMERLFEFHIESKKLHPTLIRRSFKLYIEQFDSEKAYLLEAEVIPYLNMSDKKAHEIMANLQRKNYSDFVELNQLIQKSILRAQRLRSFLSDQLVDEDLGVSGSSLPPSQYSTSEADLTGRQKNRMVRFFQFHQMRTTIDTAERKGMVFALFEKKVRRNENNYLFLADAGESMAPDRMEHLTALRILKAFAKSLDTHTSFFSPEEAYDMRLNLEKQFEGVGVVLSEGIDGIMIAELVKGSPAEQSGRIQINDLLVEIDGKSLEETSFEEVLDLLKKKDSKAAIVLGFRRTDQVFRVPLKKRPIVMNDERIEVSTEKFGSGIIGKITLHSFYESSDGVTSEKDIKEAIQTFREKGDVYGLVLDLRDNSGGFLSQAVKVAGLFVSNGVIVISKYGRGEMNYLRNIVGRSFFNRPLVILTSKMSASASEIVAQALQDYGVAVVVGDERTFGKGSIQYQTVTDEKAELFFKVTVGRYYTVSGKSTQIDGVIADIVVPTQYAPYNIGERYLEYPLPPDRVAAAYLDPLSDLDEPTQLIFQKRYLPHLQRVVPFWKKMIPSLRKNSAYRIAHNPAFKAFLESQERIKARLKGLPVNTLDDQFQAGTEDLQMQEAVNIVKDMIYMEAAQTDPTYEALYSPTGSD